MANSNATQPSTATSASFAAVQAATDDLISRLRALENSSGTAPRQIAIGRALSLLISNLCDDIDAEPAPAANDASAVPARGVYGYAASEETVDALRDGLDALRSFYALADALSTSSHTIPLTPTELCGTLRVVTSYFEAALTNIQGTSYGNWSKSA